MTSKLPLAAAAAVTLTLLAACQAAVVTSPTHGCGACVHAECPKDATACPAGGALLRDACGCCARGVCALPEGAKCFDPSLRHVLPPGSRALGACADSLRCELRIDLADGDEAEAECVCKETQDACGSDGRNYASVCQMAQEAARAGTDLYVKHWGPCPSAPWVVGGPRDATAALHDGLALDCEVKGFPVPAVRWEFIGDDGSRRALPADDLFVAVQVRGGPEPYMVTSWLQIADLRPSDAGTYTCVASNAQGAASAAALVTLRG